LLQRISHANLYVCEKLKFQFSFNVIAWIVIHPSSLEAYTGLCLLSRTASVNLKEPANNTCDALAGDGKKWIFIAVFSTSEPLSTFFSEVLTGPERLS
jgi:hypothetical protein